METNVKTEEKIIEAATKIFLEKGKDGARMQEIADRAGINKALLHYYFRSKEKLYAEVFSNELRKFFRSILGTIKESEDFKDFIQTFINLYIDTISKNPKLFRFILWEIEIDPGCSEEFDLFNGVYPHIGFKVGIDIYGIQGKVHLLREDPDDLVPDLVECLGVCIHLLFPYITYLGGFSLDGPVLN